MSAKGKILEEIHPLNIIREVQKRPALYTKDGTERANLHLKNKIWNEIAKSLFPEWESFSKHNKLSKVTDLMKKWRNLRDTFKRQLELERKMKDGHVIKKKTYVYFKHMSFLLPHVQAADSDQEGPSYKPGQPQQRLHSNAKRTAPTESRNATASHVYVEDIDEDKHFLMSLIPSFKKMTDEEKLTAKVEILNVIKSVRSKGVATTGDYSFQQVNEVDSVACGYVSGDFSSLEGIRGIKVEHVPITVDVLETDEDIRDMKAEQQNVNGLETEFTYESDNGSESMIDSD
ncbi:uncharacterized protein ACR2FA_007499 [Aphomia sociella]